MLDCSPARPPVLVMNLLYALLIPCQLTALSSYALTLRFPERSTTGLNSTVDGPVPPVCQQPCAPIAPFAIGGQSCTPSLCCSSQWEESYYSCIICAAQAQDITDLTTAQTTLDGINADCAASGINLPLLTFPGQPSNRTLPSPSILPSASASGTLPATISPTGSSLSGLPTASASTTSPSSSSSTSSTSSTSSPTQSKNAAPSIRIPWSAFMVIIATTIAGSLL